MASSSGARARKHTPLSVFSEVRRKQFEAEGREFKCTTDLLSSGIYDEFVSLKKHEKEQYVRKAKQLNRNEEYRTIENVGDAGHEAEHENMYSLEGLECC